MDIALVEKKVKSKSLNIWLFVFLSLYIKSNIVLFSLYSFHVAVLYFGIFSIFPIIFIISFSLLFSDRGQVIYLFTANLILSLLLITDIIYGRAFGQPIGLYTILSKNRFDDLGESIISLIKWWEFLLLLDLPVLYALIFKTPKGTTIKIQKIAGIACAVICAFLMIFQFIRLENNRALGNLKKLPLKISPVGYHMFDLYRFIYESTDELDHDDVTAIENWFENNSKLHTPSDGFSSLKGLLKNKNIIVVQFESLEGSLIGKSFFGTEITPSINKLLKNSISFNNIYEQTNEGNSSDAELLALTSMYPLKSGSAFLRFGKNSYVSFPKLLNKAGYTSIAIHGDDDRFWNRNIVFPNLGFEKYITEEQFADKRMGGMGVIDESLFNQSLMELNNIQSPYFFYIITITSHMPFKLNGIEFEEFPLDSATGDYLRSIRYTDAMLGKFCDALNENDMLDNTALVVFGDHEGLHKYYPSDSEIPANNLKIPFLIYIPGFEGFEASTLGGQVDIMPTLCFLLGIDEKNYSNSVMGRNLFGEKDSAAVLLRSGEIIGNPNAQPHLPQAHDIAQLIIRGNYFNIRDASD